jgi:hypothetical protein
VSDQGSMMGMVGGGVECKSAEERNGAVDNV